MCGRFTLTVEPGQLQEALELGEVPADLQPRYNIAPSQPVPVVTNPETRQVELYRWGLIPSWAKDPKIGNRMINARAETLADRPGFRAAFSRRRCLVLADGFYEWRSEGKKKGSGSQPYYFRLASGDPFAFAGLWEVWRSPEDELWHTCTLITCPADDKVAYVHERMPVILSKPEMWQWLDPAADPKELQALLDPYPSEQITMYPIQPLVNSPAIEQPQLIEPIGDALR